MKYFEIICGCLRIVDPIFSRNLWAANRAFGRFPFWLLTLPPTLCINMTMALMGRLQYRHCHWSICIYVYVYFLRVLHAIVCVYVRMYAVRAAYAVYKIRWCFTLQSCKIVTLCFQWLELRAFRGLAS